MKMLSKTEYNLLETILKLKQKELKKSMSHFLKSKYSKVKETKEYIYAEGNIPVALVAHLDTIHKSLPKEIYYDMKKGVIWSPQGLGADDRAGVYAIVKILETEYRPHIIFTTDEEIGGIGAEAIAKDFKKGKGLDLKYIIELDRQGSVDCVFYECDNPQFTLYVESFGFFEDFGSYSDICEFCPKWGIAGVNLSIGYYNEHTKAEYLNVSHMMGSILKVLNMLEEIETADYFKYIPNKKDWYTRYCEEFGIVDVRQNNEVICAGCGNVFNDFDSIPVLTDQGTKYFCLDCVGNRYEEIKWCEECGNAYISKINTKCQHCEELEGKEEWEKELLQKVMW